MSFCLTVTQSRSSAVTDGVRQLDGADSSIHALPAIVDAVGSQIEVHKELDITMAFCGHTDLRKVDTQILLPGTFAG